MKQTRTWACMAIAMLSLSAYGQKKWSLQQCIDYALQNNISLKQNIVAEAQTQADLEASKAALLPNVSFSTNQNMSYRPFSQSTFNLTNGTMTSSSNEISYNGNYGINANWTVWNGWKNTRTVKRNEFSKQIAELQAEQTANSIQEQIAQLYIQILYEAEAVKVDEEIVKASQMQRDRAAERVRIGDLAKVELAQLEAQVTQDQYSLVSAQAQLANYKLQLKQLLELHGEEDFDVEVPEVSDQTVQAAIPAKADVYAIALQNRPEIQSGKLNIEASHLDVAIAKAGYLPTLSMNAGVGSSNSSGISTAVGTQFKNNLSNSLGLTLSIPIFDQKQTKSAVQRARLNVENSQLSLENAQKQLYSEIENYWLGATTAQKQYLSAKANVESMQESYDLVSEQFKLGLKNIVELTTGKNNLLTAQQQLLQSKYTALFNLAMLRFYEGQAVKL